MDKDILPELLKEDDKKNEYEEKEYGVKGPKTGPFHEEAFEALEVLFKRFGRQMKSDRIQLLELNRIHDLVAIKCKSCLH